MVVSYDLDSVVLPHTDARVAGAEVDADCRPLTLPGHLPQRESQELDGGRTMRDSEEKRATARL